MEDEGRIPEPGEGSAVPDPPDDPLRRDAEEVRRLVDAGAGSPEELRALAERIRAHKALEQSRWRSDVKPELLAGKKWRNRRTATDDDDADREVRRNLKVGGLLVGGALVLLLLATRSGILFVVLPVLVVLVYAYRQGRRPPTDQGDVDVSGP